MQANTFHNKFYTIMENIGNGNYNGGLMIVNQLTGKKKKDAGKLNNEQQALINLLKSYCYLKLNRLGEAEELFLSYLNHFKNYTSDEFNVKKVCQPIAAIQGRTKELREFYDTLKDSKNTKDSDLYFNHCLQEGNFSLAQQLAMKNFKASDNPKYLLGSQCQQYLNFMKESDENYLGVADVNKLKMINMFQPKLSGLFEKDTYLTNDDNEKRVCYSQYAKFKGEILCCTKNWENLFKLIDTDKGIFYFDEYLEWCVTSQNSYENTQQDQLPLKALDVFWVYIRQMSSIQNFRANWEMVDIFLTKIFELHKKGLVVQSFDDVFDQDENLDGGDIIQKFIEKNKSCIDTADENLDNKNLVQRLLLIFCDNFTKDVEKSNDLYKFFIKNNLLQALLALSLICYNIPELSTNQTVHLLIKNIIIRYINFLSKTNTFLEEIFKILTNYFDKGMVQMLTQQVPQILHDNVTNTANLEEKALLNIQQIKFEIFSVDLCSSCQTSNTQLNSYIKKAFELYSQHYIACFGSLDAKPHIEKGSRLPTDDFLQIIMDLIRVIFFSIKKRF